FPAAQARNDRRYRRRCARIRRTRGWARDGAGESAVMPPENSRPGGLCPIALRRELSSPLRHVGLPPPLPASALSSPILMGRIEGEEHVLQGNNRRRETP